ncbi:MAG: M14 family zinc carboxypeptidase [Bacteroidota bacterium]
MVPALHKTSSANWRSLLLAACLISTLAAVHSPLIGQQAEEIASNALIENQLQEESISDSDMAADLAEALTFTKYPTYGQYVEMMQQFATTYPEICRLDTFGTTEQGRLLLAMKISDHAGLEEPEARFLYSATVHGDELVGYPLMLRLIDFLLSGYGNDTEVTRLVENLAIWINPLANPDGTFYPDNDTSVAGAIRGTSKGIDMNRNFPDPAVGEDFDDTTGRAMETRMMMQFLLEKRFTMSANIHGGAEVVNYPWDHTYDLHADDSWFRFVSREYADEARAVDPGYMALFEDGITNGAEWYRIYGGRQDYVTHYLEGREVTLELSNTKQLESEYLDGFWQKNERSFLNYMAQCMYGIRGVVTDSLSGEPVRARIEIPGHDLLYSVVHSTSAHGDYYRLIKEGTYDMVASAHGYLTDTITGVAVTDYQPTILDISLVPEKTDHVETTTTPSITIWPNPASTLLYIEPHLLPGSTMDLKLFSMDGQIHLHRTIPVAEKPEPLFVGSLPPGLYILKIASGNETVVRKFIRQ